MRKTVVLASLMLTLLTLTALMPAVKAVTYYWDGVRFVEGQLAPGHYIQYPHPDRDYYGIFPYSKWSKEGVKLYHNQLDYSTSIALTLTAPIIGAAIGAIIGTRIGHPVLCGFLGLVLGTVLTWVAHVYFLDECNCIWWWISTLFMDWLTENAWWLTIKCITNPSEAQTDIMYAFLIGGYLRVGSVTFYDAVGAGNPQLSYTLTISAGPGGTTEYPHTPGTYAYSYEQSVTVMASPDSHYDFDYWTLDGATKYGNPITVTMISDHTLRAYFEYSSGGGGCPTLFVWHSTDYAEEGILNVHAESDVTVQHEIQNILALDDGVYKAQLRELDEFTSHIDQVRLYAVDGEGEWYSCPITYAYHNELGKVKHTLRFDDDNRVDLKPTEIIDLKFGQPIPYSETEYFIFEINGYNLKPLMEAW